MPYAKAKDGVEIYYEATGKGTPFLYFERDRVRTARCGIFIRRRSSLAITAS